MSNEAIAEGIDGVQSELCSIRVLLESVLLRSRDHLAKDLLVGMVNNSRVWPPPPEQAERWGKELARQAVRLADELLSALKQEETGEIDPEMAALRKLEREFDDIKQILDGDGATSSAREAALAADALIQQLLEEREANSALIQKMKDEYRSDLGEAWDKVKELQSQIHPPSFKSVVSQDPDRIAPPALVLTNEELRDTIRETIESISVDTDSVEAPGFFEEVVSFARYSGVPDEEQMEVAAYWYERGYWFGLQNEPEKGNA